MVEKRPGRYNPATQADTEKFFRGVAITSVSAKDVSMNIGQKYILVTEDKVKICIDKHRDRLKSRDAWIAPASLLVTAAAVRITTGTYKEFIFKGDVWEAMFGILVFVSAVWLVVSLARLFWYVSTAIDIIADLKSTGFTYNATTEKMTLPDDAL